MKKRGRGRPKKIENQGFFARMNHKVDSFFNGVESKMDSTLTGIENSCAGVKNAVFAVPGVKNITHQFATHVSDTAYATRLGAFKALAIGGPVMAFLAATTGGVPVAIIGATVIMASLFGGEK